MLVTVSYWYLRRRHLTRILDNLLPFAESKILFYLDIFLTCFHKRVIYHYPIFNKGNGFKNNGKDSLLPRANDLLKRQHSNLFLMANHHINFFDKAKRLLSFPTDTAS